MLPGKRLICCLLFGRDCKQKRGALLTRWAKIVTRQIQKYWAAADDQKMQTRANTSHFGQGNNMR
jgi:hypothetical protein